MKELILRPKLWRFTVSLFNRTAQGWCSKAGWPSQTVFVSVKLYSQVMDKKTKRSSAVLQVCEEKVSTGIQAKDTKLLKDNSNKKKTLKWIEIRN